MNNENLYIPIYEFYQTYIGIYIDLNTECENKDV